MLDALAEFAVARGQFVGALLQFAEQPRILQRDDRLIRKGTDEFDLPLGKGLHPLPPESNRADHGPLPQQRHAEHSPGFRERNRLGHRVFRVGRDVVDVDDPPLERGPSSYGPAARQQ